MHYIISTALIVITLAGSASGDTENSCYTKAVSFQTVPHDRHFTITLEARRVQAIKENSMIYNLGREMITIDADSFDSQHFLKSVADGRCSDSVTVRLEPDHKNPFNTRFKAVDPRNHRTIHEKYNLEKRNGNGALRREQRYKTAK